MKNWMLLCFAPLWACVPDAKFDTFLSDSLRDNIEHVDLNILHAKMISKHHSLENSAKFERVYRTVCEIDSVQRLFEENGRQADEDLSLNANLVNEYKSGLEYIADICKEFGCASEPDDHLAINSPPSRRKWNKIFIQQLNLNLKLYALAHIKYLNQDLNSSCGFSRPHVKVVKQSGKSFDLESDYFMKDQRTYDINLTRVEHNGTEIEVKPVILTRNIFATVQFDSLDPGYYQITGDVVSTEKTSLLINEPLFLEFEVE